MEINSMLLFVLFLAGLLNIYFHVPSKKLYSWFHSVFAGNSSNVAKNNAHKDENKISSSYSTCSSSDDNKKGDLELKSMFATFDKNGDGFITKQELSESLRSMTIFLSEKEVEEMVVKVDSNGDGLIDFEEFCILCKATGGDADAREEEQGGGGEVELKEAFDVFDKDRDGLITVEELGSVLSCLGLNEGKRLEDCKEMIRKVDMDGDGKVNFDEFKRMMRGSGGNGILVSAF